jgi:uncharacterized ferritin-like protein (DUF455 family)
MTTTRTDLRITEAADAITASRIKDFRRVAEAMRDLAVAWDTVAAAEFWSMCQQTRDMILTASSRIPVGLSAEGIRHRNELLMNAYAAIPAR